MSKYNVSKKEAEKYGIARVKVGGGSSDSSGGSQLDALSKKLESSMMPSAEETSTEQTLGNLLSSESLGLAKIKDQPIASDFTRGQSLGLQRETLAKAEPLQQKLARFQSQRQSAADVLKAKLGIEQTKIAQSQAQQQFQQSQSQFEKNLAEQARQFNIQEGRLGAQQQQGDSIMADILAFMNPQQQTSLTNQGTTNLGISYDPISIFRQNATKLSNMK